MDCRCLWLMGSISLALVASVFAASAVYGETGTKSDDSLNVSRDAMFQASATIMGLAIFGSILYRKGYVRDPNTETLKDHDPLHSP